MKLETTPRDVREAGRPFGIALLSSHILQIGELDSSMTGQGEQTDAERRQAAP